MIHLGIIGYGYWGPNLTRNFVEIPESTVVHVADLDPARLALARSRYPGVKVSTDSREMLKDPRVDAVAIATPVSTHYELAREVLESGRHVLVEKPMTETVRDGERLIELAEKKNRVLMVDHTFLYAGAVRKIKEIMDRRELGEVYYFDSVRVNLGLFQQDVNVLWDLAAHDVAIMNHVLGLMPTAVSAIGAWHFKEGAEDIAYLTALFEGRCIAHFHVNWLAPVKVRMTLIGGSRKMVVYDDTQASEKVKVYDKGLSVETREDIYRILVQYRSGDMQAPQLDPTEPLQIECLHFLDCIRTGRKPLSDGQLGLNVVRILQAAQRSMRNRGRIVPVNGSADP
ncbi:MAG TPA: Gfo/Idh/MocA family oxidoreductase [Candidatus Polarisedimenticolia bacterium]|nr:Gfo/Idh/MocA family oxidoreductase [Candidatus Polarisedimenticolia bacterium]